MTIFDVLANRHQQVDALFRKAQDASAAGELDEARAAAQQLCTRLIACMRSEHAVVYPCFAFSAGLDDEITRAIREHDAIERAINHLRIGVLSPEAWQGALTRLQCLVTDHVETEEWFLFPVARLRLTTEAATHLAADFESYERVAESVAEPSITYDLVA